MAKLTKLSDNKFEGKHPKGINVGYVKDGYVSKLPKVGESFCISNMTTSLVTEIVSTDNNEIMFNTEHSTYKLVF